MGAGPGRAGRMLGWDVRGDRAEACAWARANGIDPNRVSAHYDVEVFLLDCPAIRRREYVLNESGEKQLSCRVPLGREMHPDRVDHKDCVVLTREVVTALIVPMPEHLADPV